jgi:hypothetical protein
MRAWQDEHERAMAELRAWLDGGVDSDISL